MRNTIVASAASLILANVALAPAAQACGLIDSPHALNNYTFTLSNNLAKATGDDGARLSASAFIKYFEEKLKKPEATNQVVMYPKEASQEMLRIVSVVPAKGLGAMDLPICAQQHGKVIGLWNITSSGNVKPVTDWIGATTSDSRTSNPCKEFILAARRNFTQMEQKLVDSIAGGSCLTDKELAAQRK